MKTLLSILSITLAASIGVAQSPGGVSSGLTVWLKPDAAGMTPAADGSAVETWNDASGLANHATQATLANRPQYYSNVFNGNPALGLTANRFLNIDFSEISNTNYTIITVSKRNQATGSLLSLLGTVSGQGLTLFYPSSTVSRHKQFSNWVSMTIPAYSANELPCIMACHFNTTAGKKAWRIHDGANVTRTGSNITSYASTGQGRIGRGEASDYFNGYLAEVIVYDRVLTSTEVKQIHTYLSVKYGLSVPIADHLYPFDATFQNDVFGIGSSTTSNLNQPTSESAGIDDIIQISNPSSLGNEEYLFCGNDNTSTTFGAYVGSKCTVNSILARDWKFRQVGNVGTVDLRFDMTGIAGVTTSDLRLLVDLDGDGYDDESLLSGSYSAPYFTVTGVTIPNNARLTLCQAKDHYYAVATGESSAAIWSDSPAGAPGFLPGACTDMNLTITAGNVVDNNLATLTCRNITLEAGATFNAGLLATQIISINGDIVTNGVWNDQNSVVNLNGTTAQNISGTGYLRLQNCNITNTAGVSINNLGVIAYGNLTLTAGGVITTNNKLTLWSDINGTAEIQSLAAGTVNGEVNVRRYRPSGPIGWVNFSSALQNAIIEDWDNDITTTGFSGSDYPTNSFISMLYYDETVAGAKDQGYVGVTSDLNPLVPGRGYYVYLPAGVATLTARGIINSGDMNLNVQYTANGTGAGWNLVGNPYPATINWDSPSWTKTNMNNAVYVYRASINQYASYVGGVATNGGSALIAPGQSFFVEANSASPSLIVRENCKSASPGTFRAMQSNPEILSIRMKLGDWQDEAILVSNEFAGRNFDPTMDAKKLRSPMEEAPYMAILDDAGENLSIKNISLSSEEQIIPVRIESGVGGVYLLEVTGLNAFARGARITLEDVFTNSVYVLSEGSGIQLPLVAGDKLQRYQLRIGAAPIAVRESNELSNELVELVQMMSNEPQSASQEQVVINDANEPTVHSQEFAADVVAALTANGVQLNFLFDEMKNIRINAYNVLGQQLIEPIVGQFGRQTITFGDRRYAANALVEVTDLNSGERTLIRLGR